MQLKPQIQRMSTDYHGIINHSLFTVRVNCGSVPLHQ